MKGEFEKRIDDIEQTDYWHFQAPCGDFRTLIDEARKDFLPYFNFREYLLSLNPIPTTHQEVHEAYQKYVSEIITKLKKWFGDVAKIHR